VISWFLPPRDRAGGRTKLLWHSRLRPHPVLGKIRTANAVPPETLSFRELEAFTRSLLSILLALFTAGVAGKEAFHFQLLAQFHVELQQRAGNAHLQCAGLAVDSAAGNVRRNVKGGGGFAGDQRLLHLDSLRIGQEILVKFAPVDHELAAAGTQENPGHT